MSFSLTVHVLQASAYLRNIPHPHYHQQSKFSTASFPALDIQSANAWNGTDEMQMVGISDSSFQVNFFLKRQDLNEHMNIQTMAQKKQQN